MRLGALHRRLGSGGEAAPREALAPGALKSPAPQEKTLVRKICKAQGEGEITLPLSMHAISKCI